MAHPKVLRHPAELVTQLVLHTPNSEPVASRDRDLACAGGRSPGFRVKDKDQQFEKVVPFLESLLFPAVQVLAIEKSTLATCRKWSLSGFRR